MRSGLERGIPILPIAGVPGPGFQAPALPAEPGMGDAGPIEMTGLSGPHCLIGNCLVKIPPNQIHLRVRVA